MMALILLLLLEKSLDIVYLLSRQYSEREVVQLTMLTDCTIHRTFDVHATSSSV